MHAALVYCFFIFIFLIAPTHTTQSAAPCALSNSTPDTFVILHEQTPQDNQAIIRDLISLIPNDPHAIPPLCTRVSSYLSELFKPFTKEQALEHCNNLSQYLLSKIYFTPVQNLKQISEDKPDNNAPQATPQKEQLLKLYRSIAYYEFEQLRNQRPFAPKVEMSLVEKQDEHTMRYVKYILIGLIIYQIFDTIKKSEQLSSAERIAAEERRENAKIREAAADRLGIVATTKNRDGSVYVDAGGQNQNNDTTERLRLQTDERKKTEFTTKMRELTNQLTALQTQTNQAGTALQERDQHIQALETELAQINKTLTDCLDKETGQALRNKLRIERVSAQLNKPRLPQRTAAATQRAPGITVDINTMNTTLNTITQTITQMLNP